ncbi:MAG: YbaB/EbfC family nucleoid-associated protein [Treponema sp.]|jgi:DNA-binding YbaB/EbfC family protein|nr:YbaB/EbfC family nucleoid-associated protein [Treponema sp.]
MNINPFDLLKNAQKIQEQMNGFQERLADITVTGASGAGMVEIDINGKMDVTDIRIAPEIVNDIEMLQDLIISAFTDGMAKVREEISSQAAAITGGLNLQGLNIPGFPA